MLLFEGLTGCNLGRFVPKLMSEVNFLMILLRILNEVYGNSISAWYCMVCVWRPMESVLVSHSIYIFFTFWSVYAMEI